MGSVGWVWLKVCMQGHLLWPAQDRAALSYNAVVWASISETQVKDATLRSIEPILSNINKQIALGLTGRPCRVGTHETFRTNEHAHD